MVESDKFQRKMGITVKAHYEASASKLVSLIRELEKILGKEKAHEIVSNWAEQNAVDDVKGVIESLEKPVENFEDVKALLRQWVHDLNQNNMETASITEETSTKSVCIATECIYAKVFNSLNAADLGYLLYCKHDFATTPVIHPDLKLKRNKTLMQNDDCCDFVYYVES